LSVGVCAGRSPALPEQPTPSKQMLPRVAAIALRTNPMLVRPSRRDEFSEIEEDRHRAVVGDLDHHAGAEPASGDVDPRGAQRLIGPLKSDESPDFLDRFCPSTPRHYPIPLPMLSPLLATWRNLRWSLGALGDLFASFPDLWFGASGAAPAVGAAGCRRHVRVRPLWPADRSRRALGSWP
jgi:hypothetical protein